MQQPGIFLKEASGILTNKRLNLLKKLLGRGEELVLQEDLLDVGRDSLC